jgi:hypothetical protein
MASPSTNPLWGNELLNDEWVQCHFDQGITPIVVYSEIVFGNPLKAHWAVRYLLNFPGALGGPKKKIDSNDMILSYAKGMNPWNTESEMVLHLPPCDTSIYYPPPASNKRSGSCFYAAKFKSVYRQETFAITNGMTEITRDGADVMAPIEIANLFRKSEFFYCYENSSLAIEARLCGCPVIFLPNAYFDKIIAADEAGLDGIAWGNSEEQVKFAKETVHLFFEKYKSKVDLFWQQLDIFIEATQARAKQTVYHEKIQFAKGQTGLGELEIYRQVTSMGSRIATAISYLLKTKGPLFIVTESLKYIRNGKNLKYLLGDAERDYLEETLDGRT